MLNKNKNISKITNANKTILNKLYYNECKIIKKGLPDKNYIIDKYNNNVWNIYNLDDLYLQNVTGDDNCGYRNISLQIYGREEKYVSIRQDIYRFLTTN